MFKKNYNISKPMTVKIVSDTSADLNCPDDKTLYEKYDVEPVSMHIIFGVDDYEELKDITTSGFYEKFKTSKDHPHTSQPSQQAILEAYEKFSKDYDEIISFHISSGLSGSYPNAMFAKKMYEKKNPDGAKVYPFDTKVASSYHGLMVIKATQLAKEGKNAEEIMEAIVKWRENNSELYFTVEDLVYLFKGGRLSRAKYYAAKLMSLKPIIVLKDGKLEVVKRSKGIDLAIDDIFDLQFEKFAGQENITVHFMEAEYTDKVKEVQELIKERYPQLKIGETFKMGGTIASHTGPGTLGIIFTTDIEV